MRFPSYSVLIRRIRKIGDLRNIRNLADLRERQP